MARARQLAEAAGNELSPANSLEVEAGIHRGLGDARLAVQHYREAAKLYSELGVPELAARCWQQVQSLEAAQPG